MVDPIKRPTRSAKRIECQPGDPIILDPKLTYFEHDGPLYEGTEILRRQSGEEIVEYHWYKPHCAEAKNKDRIPILFRSK